MTIPEARRVADVCRHALEVLGCCEINPNDGNRIVMRLRHLAAAAERQLGLKGP